MRGNGKGSAIYTVRPDGLGLALLSPRGSSGSGFEYRNPAWSPDGHRLAFERCSLAVNPCGSGYSLWTMRADGSQLRQIAACSNTFCPTHPSWLADGKTLVVESNSALWMIGADGERPRLFLRPPLPAGASRGGADFPYASPKTAWVAYRTFFANASDADNWSIRAVRQDGTGDQAVTTSQPQAGVRDSQIEDMPSGWSPKGDLLLDIRDLWVSGTLQWSRLYVVNPSNKGTRLLAKVNVNNASFSSDGRSIAVTTNSAPHVAVVGVNGGTMRRLTTPPPGTWEWDVAWQPSTR